MILCSILVMSVFASFNHEKLVSENGKSAAKVLPLDVANAARSFETATFGMG